MRNVLLCMSHFSFIKSLSSFRFMNKTFFFFFYRNIIKQQLIPQGKTEQILKLPLWYMKILPHDVLFHWRLQRHTVVFFLLRKSLLSSDMIWDSELALVCFKIRSEGDLPDETSHFKCFMKIFGEVNERYKRLHCAELFWFHFRTVLTWN